MKFITVDKTGNISGMYLEAPDNGIELNDEDWQSVGPGYQYIDGKLVAPAGKTAGEIQEENDANKKAVNSLTKQNLMQDASDKISVLQDSVDLDMATAEESASLTEWKKYRVLLNRVDTDTLGEISWPSIPA